MDYNVTNYGSVNENYGLFRQYLLEKNGQLTSEEEQMLSILTFIEEVQKTAEWDNLQSKTQVFDDAYSANKSLGHDDYKVKTRGTHCYDVALIAKSLTESLAPGNSLEACYAYMIGLIHDLGHIAYGHAGESIADNIIKNYPMTEEEIKNYESVRKSLFGDAYKGSGEVCFEHNENSVIQYAVMCQRFGVKFDPKVVDGILAHSTSRVAEEPKELSQQAVRLADKIAYVNYDVQDMITSFQKDPERKAALMSLYSKELLDPDGRPITIKVPSILSNKYPSAGVSIMQFLGIVDENGKECDKILTDKISEGISMMIYESVRDSQNGKSLNGCQDILVAKKAINKQIKAATKALQKLTPNLPEYKIQEEKIKVLENQLKDLNKELFKRSELLYCIYEIKDRSDGLIQRNEGLNAETKVEMTQMAQSSVGNKEEKNEYVYKELVDIIQKFSNGTFKIDKNDKTFAVYDKLFAGYVRFKNEQTAALNAIQGIDNPKQLPEICTIVNYIGSYSNEQLTRMAEDLGISDRFKKYQESLEAQMGDRSLYDENGTLSAEGKSVKKDIKNDFEITNLQQQLENAINDVNNLINYLKSNNIPYDEEMFNNLKAELDGCSYNFSTQEINSVTELINKSNKEVFLTIQKITDEQFKQLCMAAVMQNKEYVSENNYGR